MDNHLHFLRVRVDCRDFWYWGRFGPEQPKPDADERLTTDN